MAWVHSVHYETIFVDLIIKKSQCEWGYSGGGKVGKVFLVVFSSALVRVEAPRLSTEVSSGFGIAWLPMDKIWDLVLKWLFIVENLSTSGKFNKELF